MKKPKNLLSQNAQIAMLKEYYSKPITITYGHGAYPVTEIVTVDEMAAGAKLIKPKRKRRAKTR